MTNQNLIDYPSTLGQFGWQKVGSEDLAIPVIVRSNNIRYAPVRVVETEIIKKYDSIPQAVFQCITLKSFYLTQCETKLLNNINFSHCNSRYGDEFFRPSDVIISAADVIELARFLNVSNSVFTTGLTSFNPNWGVIKLTLDSSDPHSGTLLVPYVGKILHSSLNQPNHTRMFVPTKLVEPYVIISSTTVSAQPSDWDIVYLKMLAVYCENNSQQYITRESGILSLDGLMYSRTREPLVYSEYSKPEPHPQQMTTPPGWCN